MTTTDDGRHEPTPTPPSRLHLPLPATNPTPSLHEPTCPTYTQWVLEQEARREARSSARMLGLGCMALVAVAVLVALRIWVFRG